LFSKQLSRKYIESIQKNNNQGANNKSKVLSKLEEDLWLERLSMSANRAVEINKIIKEEMEKYKLRDVETEDIMDKSKNISNLSLSNTIGYQMRGMRKRCKSKKRDVQKIDFEMYKNYY
jgi:hypothetical protein